MVAKQLSVFIENRQGRLGEVLNVLKENGINILSLSLADTTEYGLLRLIVNNPELGKEKLTEDGFSTILTDVIVLKITHQSGSLQGLLKILSDIAVEDYRQRGLSWQMLAEHNTAILCSRQAFRFHKMPEANQSITINTWEEVPQPLQLMRSYEIVDTETGEKLISGFSAWIIVNLATRRIVRTKDFTLRPDSILKEEHDCLEPSKIIVPQDLELLMERPIWYSDIDGNGHVNNARYGAFVIDSLPEEFQKKEFTDFKINYSKEAVKGSVLKVYGNFDESSKKITIVAKQDDNICFESECHYK